MNNASKTCPVCQESIQAGAKICPRCRQWQTRWGFRHPATLLALFLLCFGAIAVSLMVFLNRIGRPEPNYAAFNGQIQVSQSRMSAERTDKENWVMVFGLVTNQTAFAWKELEFDCRFYDVTGALTDAKTIRSSFTMFGHGESAFRVDLKTPRPVSDYASHQISVKAARNAAAWP